MSNFEKSNFSFGQKKRDSKRQKAYKKPENIFTNEKFKQDHKVVTGTTKYDTTGNPFVDDFSNISRYCQPLEKKGNKTIKWGRPMTEVFQHMRELWNIDPITAMKSVAYIRTISRETKFPSGANIKAIGQGLKNEYICRMFWLAIFQPKSFGRNVDELISLGCWKDIFLMMERDLITDWNTLLTSIGAYMPKRGQVRGQNVVLNWKFLVDMICKKINSNDNDKDLLLKYLPQIVMRGRDTNHVKSYYVIAWEIAKTLFADEIVTIRKEGRVNKLPNSVINKNIVIKISRLYRSVKTSGEAHTWQKQISQGEIKNINLDTIPGRALNLLNKSKFFENNGLQNKREEFVKKSDTIKYTGYVYELANQLLHESDDNKIELIEKQIFELVKKFKANTNLKTNYIIGVDESGSMNEETFGIKGMSSYQVALSMAMLCSYSDEGVFHNTYLGFSGSAIVREMSGNPREDIRITQKGGTTYFLSVANLFVDMIKKGAKEEDFPTGIICFSDGEFNGGKRQETAVQQFRSIITGTFSQEFVKNFKFVFWDVPNKFNPSKNKTTFETTLCEDGILYMSGFDTTALTFLFENDTIKSPLDLMLEAYNQSAFQHILPFSNVSSD